MFKEFSRISWRGIGIALAGGSTVMLAMALFYRFGVLAFAPHLIFAAGLIGARLAEACYSHNCRFSKVLAEGCLLGLLGVLLVMTEEVITSFVA